MIIIYFGIALTNLYSSGNKSNTVLLLQYEPIIYKETFGSIMYMEIQKCKKYKDVNTFDDVWLLHCFFIRNFRWAQTMWGET